MPRFEPVKFPGVDGTTLAGVLDLPDGTVRAWAVFCHGFTLGKNSAAASRVAKALAARGIGVLRYDAAGLGGSSGVWHEGTFGTKIADVVCAARFMHRQGRPARLLIGHSLGGAAVLAAAASVPEAAAVVTIGSPFEPRHVVHLFEHVLDEVQLDGSAAVILGRESFRIRRELVADLLGTDLSGPIASLGRRLLVLHSPTDATVEVANAERIFAAAAQPKSFISLDGCDHLLTERWQAERIAGLVAVWADGFLPPG
ncbi:lysophospholipase [Arthrobacter sp. I2-34]|uniref:Lysophospholipase n=1 Tax=Arthrobacter hankyongi TaxID=2904801 RepID=A0ABS9L2B2_9MICC|nr:alpha/beta fold hydrolase [Arthrobacter hankyongi]MCG2620654.1 lysophospholipase [Arthrobacter hankyongi]